MTKLSRLKTKPEIEARLIKELWVALSSFKNSNDSERFFRQFLTPTETAMFAKRLDVLKALAEDISYQTIRETVKVTDATITRVNNILKSGDKELSNQVRKLIEDEEKRRKKYIELRKLRRSSLGVTFHRQNK